MIDFANFKLGSRIINNLDGVMILYFELNEYLNYLEDLIYFHSSL